MNRPRRKWSIAAVLLAWCCARVAPIRADESANIDLDEIKRRVTEWKGSFVNLRAVWEVRSLPETNEEIDIGSSPPDPESAKVFARDEWIWADHGLDLYDEQTFFHDDGSAKIHAIDVFNGPKGVAWRADMNRPSKGPEQFRNLQLFGLGVGKPVSIKDRVPLRGLYWSGSAHWLSDVLLEWNWKLEGLETVGGEACARIVATRPDVADATIVEILWLDLNHDCLVRRYKVPAVPMRWAGRDFVVDEFQRLEGDIWFPKRGRIQLGSKGRDGAAGANENQLFIVTEAAVNQSLDLARFDPPTPPTGTHVSDRGKSYRFGVSTGQGPMGANSKASGEPPFDPNGIMSRVHAAPPSASWIVWSSALAAMSVVLLGAGFWLSQRKRKELS